MAYVIDPAAPLDAEIRRIAGEQIARMETGLKGAQSSGEDGAPDDDGEVVRAAAIHDARKRLKKLRGLLRLVRDAAPKFYAEENARYRDAAKRLAPFRDSVALVETLDGLARHDEGTVAATLFDDARQALIARRDAALSRSEADDPKEAIEATLADIGEGRQRLDGFVIDRKAKAATILSKGYARTFRRARHCLKTAERSDAADDFHALRKRLKYRWMHLRLLRPLWPAIHDAMAGDTKAVVDALGADHDLCALQDELDGATRDRGDGEAYGPITALIKRRRNVLRHESRLAARRLLCERTENVEWLTRRLSKLAKRQADFSCLAETNL